MVSLFLLGRLFNNNGLNNLLLFLLLRSWLLLLLDILELLEQITSKATHAVHHQWDDWYFLTVQLFDDFFRIRPLFKL